MKVEILEDFVHPLSPIQNMNGTNGGKVVSAPSAASSAPDNASPLANRKAPYYQVQKEAPAHRVMLEYAAKGYTVKEIAELTGRTPVCVNNILRQPHSQQTLVNEIRRIHGEDEEVVEIIKNNVVAACRLNEKILNGGELADSIEDRKLQIEVAERFMNRRYGKPNTPINRGTDVDLNTLSIAEIASLLPQTEGTK